MTRSLKYPLTALALSATLMAPVSAAVHSVSAKLDSAYLLMGKQTDIHLEVIEDSGTNGRIGLQGDSIMPAVEIAAINLVDSTDMGDGRHKYNYDITIQSFDSGSYALPPIPYVVGKDTAYSNKVTLSVVPVVVDSLPDIHPYEGPVAVQGKWYDFLPDWLTDNWLWILIGLLVVAGAIIAYVMNSGKSKILRPAKKAEPPYDVAVRELNRLHADHLCEQGQEREYYTRLTEILRVYLEHRFDINAMEMTSSQILDALQSREETRLPKDYMKRVLEIADFVKFAKMRPMPEDNEQAFGSAMRFVEDTKPLPTPDDADQSKEPTHPKND